MSTPVLPSRPRSARVAASLAVLALGSASLCHAAEPRVLPTLRAGSELAVYGDTNHVSVFTTTFFAGAESQEKKWAVDGSFLVDVVSAASPDIVSMASPRWVEARHQITLGGYGRVGKATITPRAMTSIEHDFQSVTGGATVSLDMLHKGISPLFGYDYAHDVISRRGTPFSVFAHPVDRHALTFGAGFAVDRATMFYATGNAIVELGDQSKPYRYIPMFDQATLPELRYGMSADEVNRLRRDERPLEQLPLEKYRFALDGLFLRRYSASTLRLEERLYADSWGLKASTTDLRYILDATNHVRVFPHVRMHAQTGVDFWRAAYVASSSSLGSRLPVLRTGDAELGPMLTWTLGLGARFAFGKNDLFALTLTGEASHAWFLEHLLLKTRLSVLTVGMVEVKY